MVMLYLLLMIQNCTFQLLLCQKKIFQRSIYWNEYKTKEQTEDANANATKYINLNLSFQGANRLFIMAYNRLAALMIINSIKRVNKYFTYQEMI